MYPSITNSSWFNKFLYLSYRTVQIDHWGERVGESGGMRFETRSKSHEVTQLSLSSWLEYMASSTKTQWICKQKTSIRSQQEVVLFYDFTLRSHCWLITVLFMAFIPVWVYCYLKSHVKKLPNMKIKQTSHPNKQPHSALLHCSGLVDVSVSCVSCQRQARSRLSAPLSSPFLTADTFRKPNSLSHPPTKPCRCEQPWPLTPQAFP